MKLKSKIIGTAVKCSFYKLLRGSAVFLASSSIFLSACSLVGYQFESPMMGERYELNKILSSNNLKAFDRDFERYIVGKPTAVFKKLFHGSAYSQEIIRKDVYGSVAHYYTFQQPDCSLLVLFSKKEDKIIGLRKAIYLKFDGVVLPYYRDVDDTKDIYTGKLEFIKDYMGRSQVGGVIENFTCSLPRQRLKNFIDYGADPARIEEMNKATGFSDTCEIGAGASWNSACLQPLE